MYLTPNMRKFILTALYGAGRDGGVCMPVLDRALFAPKQGLHFQALHPLTFLFICIFHWLKHWTGLEVTLNMRKFTLTALCGAGRDGVVCRPVQDRALFAPSESLHFYALHPLSFLFICTLHWCKHCTGLEVTTNMRKFTLTALCGAERDGVACRPVQDRALFAPKQGLHFQAL